MSMNIITPLLAKLHYQCVIEGTFPSILKIAQVVPIYKNGPKEKCCNYRPISLLSPFSKSLKNLSMSNYTLTLLNTIYLHLINLDSNKTALLAKL